VTLNNSSVGVIITDCETDVPYASLRTNLTLTLPAHSHTLISSNFQDAIELAPIG
jgi:hypothetical protein